MEQKGKTVLFEEKSYWPTSHKLKLIQLQSFPVTVSKKK